MKSLTTLFAGLALLLALPTARAAESPVLTVAVFNFECTDPELRDAGAKVGVLLTANLSADPRLITVERAELQKSLGEQELGLSGTISADTAAKVGHLTGAKVLVTGRVFKVDRELLIVAKFVSTETSRVYGETVKGVVSASLADLVAELAKKVGDSVSAKADTLVAKTKTREEVIEEIKKGVTSQKLPTVSVRIPEHHFGRPVVDPAAQTEIAFVLQKCGFTVVDDKTDQKPDIEITGEAFSEMGMRKGNLFSCHSRVELKVRQRASGAVIMVERETTVAVELSEHIAAKNALQNAGLQLAGRIVPKIAK